MAGVLRDILAHGYVYREYSGHLTKNTIKNKIYQSLSYLRTTMQQWADIMGRIEVKPMDDGWSIAATASTGIVSDRFDHELVEFLQGGTGTFERRGILLTYDKAQEIKSILPQNTLSVIRNGEIFIKFI